MAVNISGLRRNMKNVAHNYTDAQVKVREATSNDPWGPSSTMMSEVADLTYNVVAFSEIMQMVWKRLNDHGKNWRHVYKALVLLEYLIKTGSEKVAQQCKENIFAIQTLKDFQYLDDNKDQGINVREKAKSLVALLKDDERLKNERVRALKAKERFAQSTAGIGSDTVYNHTRERFETAVPAHPGADCDPQNPEIEAARPQTAGEEELQLQLALAMSREEAETEDTKGKSDDMRLKMALEKSKQTLSDDQQKTRPSNDLLDLDFGNPTATGGTVPLAGAAASASSLAQPPPPPRTVGGSIDPWGMPGAASALAGAAVANNDPWGASAATQAAPEPKPINNDPWSPVGAAPTSSAMRTSPAAAMAMSTSPVGMHHNQASSVIIQQSSANNDPWKAPLSSSAAVHSMRADPESIIVDPFSPAAQNQLAEFDLLRTEIETKSSNGENNNGLLGKPTNGASNGGSTSPNPFGLNDLTGTMAASSSPMLTASVATGAKPKKSAGVQSLLGEHSNLVNLDDLVSSAAPSATRNPFEQQPPNPFQAKAQKPAMNELIQQNSAWGSGGHPQQQQQEQNQAEFNPFF